MTSPGTEGCVGGCDLTWDRGGWEDVTSPGTEGGGCDLTWDRGGWEDVTSPGTEGGGGGM